METEREDFNNSVKIGRAKKRKISCLDTNNYVRNLAQKHFEECRNLVGSQLWLPLKPLQAKFVNSKTRYAFLGPVIHNLTKRVITYLKHNVEQTKVMPRRSHETCIIILQKELQFETQGQQTMLNQVQVTNKIFLRNP